MTWGCSASASATALLNAVRAAASGMLVFVLRAAAVSAPALQSANVHLDTSARYTMGRGSAAVRPTDSTTARKPHSSSSPCTTSPCCDLTLAVEAHGYFKCASQLSTEAFPPDAMKRRCFPVALGCKSYADRL